MHNFEVLKFGFVKRLQTLSFDWKALTRQSIWSEIQNPWSAQSQSGIFVARWSVIAEGLETI